MSVFAQPVACLLYAGCPVEEPSLMCKQGGTYTSTLWLSVSAAFTYLNSRRFTHRFLLVSRGRRGSPRLIRSAPDGRYIVSGLHTLRSAAPQRMPLSPRTVLQVGLFRQHVHPLKGALHTTQHTTVYYRQFNEYLIKYYLTAILISVVKTKIIEEEKCIYRILYNSICQLWQI